MNVIGKGSLTWHVHAYSLKSFKQLYISCLLVKVTSTVFTRISSKFFYTFADHLSNGSRARESLNFILPYNPANTLCMFASGKTGRGLMCGVVIFCMTTSVLLLAV